MQVSVTYYPIISDLDTYLLETFLSNMIKHFKRVAYKDKIHLVEQFTFGESFLFLLTGSLNSGCVVMYTKTSQGCVMCMLTRNSMEIASGGFGEGAGRRVSCRISVFMSHPQMST